MLCDGWLSGRDPHVPKGMTMRNILGLIVIVTVVVIVIVLRLMGVV